MKLENVTRVRGFASASFGPLAISIWDTTARVDDARIAADLLTTVSRRDSPILVLAVLGPETPPPDGPVRDMLAKRLTELGEKKISCVANVVEGQGFRAAALRGVLIGMAAIIRPKYPQVTCASVPEGSQVIAENSGGRLMATAVGQAILALRAMPVPG